jgi:hypothetical protein
LYPKLGEFEEKENAILAKQVIGHSGGGQRPQVQAMSPDEVLEKAAIERQEKETATKLGKEASKMLDQQFELRAGESVTFTVIDVKKAMAAFKQAHHRATPNHPQISILAGRGKITKQRKANTKSPFLPNLRQRSNQHGSKPGS